MVCCGRAMEQACWIEWSSGHLEKGHFLSPSLPPELAVCEEPPMRGCQLMRKRHKLGRIMVEEEEEAKCDCTSR